MGNRLSCSCGQPRKGYKCEDAPTSKQNQQNQQINANLTPQQIALQQSNAQRREGQLLKLWAEVFHVEQAPGGVCWKRLSEDLVPVNISCIKDTATSCIFQITAYNTMVDKVLDVRLNQPGTKIGQASECFVYWKDPHNMNTWGLNFTSAVDARNFKTLCSPQFKITRKASASYSIKDQQQSQQQSKKQTQSQQQLTSNLKRKTQSTPSSPSTRRREQLAALNQMNSTGHYPTELLAASQQYCTCMADSILNRQRNGRNVRYAASSTLPKHMFRQDGRLVAYPSQSNLIPVTSKQVASNQQQQQQKQPQQQQHLTNKQLIQQKHLLQSGPIRSRPNAQPMLTKSQLAQQRQVAATFQHRAPCGAMTKYTPNNIQVSDARSKSKSSDDIRKSVSTGTEDLLMESRSALTAQNTSHNARRLHPLPATKTTTIQQPKVSGYQSDHTGLPLQSRRMQTTGTNTTCSIPNCNLAHRSKIDAFSQQAHHPRPTSVPNWNFGTSEDSADVDVRSRPFRSESGRRRSLERTACVDYTDQSPPSDTYMIESLRKMFQQQQNLQNKQQQQQIVNGNVNATPTPSTSGDETAVLAAALNSVKQGNRKAIQQNLSAILNNKLAGKLLNNLSLQQLSKQSSTEQQQTMPSLLTQQQTTSTTSSSLSKQPSTQQPAGTSSPTIKQLQEYETHLRNMLARGNSTELENFSLNTLEALVSQSFDNVVSKSLENVVSLMNEVQSEIDAIQLEYRAEQSEKTTQPKTSQQGQFDFQSFRDQESKNGKHYWSRSYTLPSKHSLTTPLNANKPQSVTGVSPSTRLGASNLSSTNAGSLGYGLNMSGLLSGNELYREMKKRSSTPFLDAISMDNLAYLTGNWNGAGQASFESNDSRANLTWSEASDEEEIAISDEDGDLLATGRSFAESPFRQAKLNYNLQCIGAVRKAGLLSVKKWLLRKPNSPNDANIELARKRGWKSYWTCLKGTTLLLHQCDNNNGPVSFDPKPKHLIILDGSLVLPLPEHPKKENVFCLSTAFGDAYLFQASCSLELDNWTTQIHISCASAFARHRGKFGVTGLLEEEINRLQKKLEQEAKLKHMSELQLSAISDLETKRSLQAQIRIYEQNFEQYLIEQFRLRSYVASILEQEQPNPKTLLTRSSRHTKTLLNKLGVFNVSSLHAHCSAVSNSLLTSVMNSGRASTLRKRQSSTSQLSRHSSIGSRPNSRPNSAAGYGQISTPSNDLIVTLQLIYPNEELPIPIKISVLDTVEDLLWKVCNDRQLTPSDHYLQCKRIIDNERYVPHRTEIIKQHHLEVGIWRVCQKNMYQVELCRNTLDQLFGFSVEAELVESANTNSLNTSINQTANNDGQVPCGSSNTAGGNTNPSQQPATGYDELCVFVSRIEENSLAEKQGLYRGDEIMVINGYIVSELDMMYIEKILQEELSLCMMLRSCRDLSQTDVTNQFGLTAELQDALAGLQTSDEYIESLVCPPPPSDVHISDEIINKLIAPRPNLNFGFGLNNNINATSPTSRNLLKDSQSLNQLMNETFLKQSQDLSGVQWPDTNFSHNSTAAEIQQFLQEDQQSSLDYGRRLNQNLPIDVLMLGTGSLDQVEPLPTDDEPQSTDIDRGLQGPITDTERLKKSIGELVDTEKSYVNHLNNLIQLYLEPMQQLELLSNTEVLTLFYNIQDIMRFQCDLLDQLNKVLSRNSDYLNFTSRNQFSTLLCELASVFLNNAERFKLYCNFCSNHSKAMKTLYTDCNSNHKLIEFLTTSCKGEHASSLESYLIKPIQRILKYPLLIQQICFSAQPESIEREQLNLALEAMEGVAYKLNEMQRIHDEYGAIFEHLQRQHLKATKQLVHLNTSELNHHGEVQWQNVQDVLGKMKKNLDLYAVCFVFKSAVVFLCKEKIRQKKKLVTNSNKTNEVEIIRYQVLMPVNEVQVRATTVKNVSNTDENENGNATRSLFNWELIHLKCSQSGATQRRTEKVYQLANTTNDERNAFLHHIRLIIRESVRKMGLPSSKISNATNSNGAYQTLHALAKHQLITAVAATGTQLDSIQQTDQSKLTDQKDSTQSKENNDLNDDKNEKKTTTTTVKTTSTTTTKVKPAAPHPLQKQQSSSSGDYPLPPDKKIPPKPPKRNLTDANSNSAGIKRMGQKQHLSKTSSGRAFEKQRTIDEKSSPPLGT